MARCKSRTYKHTIMANGGFGPVKIIQEGVKRLSNNELSNITIAQALESCANGLAITTR